MNDDRAFLDSLIASPKDAAPWLVYADWLDERGDSRGEYLRLVHDLAQKPDDIQRRRLNAVRPMLPREWLAVVEQPALLRANPTPYPAFWPDFALRDVRLVDSTFGGNAYASLPAVPRDWLVDFDHWFARIASADSDDLATVIEDEDQWAAFPRLVAAANDFGLQLPLQFAKVIEDDRHVNVFERSIEQSLIGCEFNLPERVEPAPECPEAGLIRFSSDDQGRLHWYLYLTPEGDECVVASTAYLGGSWHARRSAGLRGNPYVEDSDDASKGGYWFCAPSFAEFIVRNWLENMAYIAQHPEWTTDRQADDLRMPEVQAYLAHYRSVSPA